MPALNLELGLGIDPARCCHRKQRDPRAHRRSYGSCSTGLQEPLGPLPVHSVAEDEASLRRGEMWRQLRRYMLGLPPGCVHDGAWSGAPRAGRGSSVLDAPSSTPPPQAPRRHRLSPLAPNAL